MTEPISQAPDLAAWLTEPEAPAGSAEAECSGVVKLEGQIGDPSDFVAALKACEDRTVVVEINSLGGSIFGALEIQKAIERHPMPVLCMVDGMAASAAFVTLQSCDVRAMTSRSVLMAHRASAATRADSVDLDNLAAALRAIDRALVLRCAKRMGMDPDDYEARVSGGREWWLGLEDALTYHAVDFEVEGLAEVEKLLRP